MKLWQKIFLSSLALIILTVNIISITLLNSSSRLLLERERNHAIKEYEYFAASFSNAVVYEKLKSEKVILGDDEIADIAERVLSGGDRMQTPAVILDQDGLLIAGSDFEDILRSPEFSKSLKSADTEGDSYNICSFRFKDQYLMTVCSSLKTEGKTYVIATASDISEIYDMRQKQTEHIRRVGLAAAAFVSLILLMTTILLLRPLNRLNIYTKSIAGGDYKVRIKPHGSQEIRELSENMNKMAEAVQERSDKLEKIAEDRQVFIANLAHEMKTPLTSILGFADILRIKKNVPDDERREYAGVIVDETKRLRSLSGKLMELVALGGTEIEKKPVSLSDMIHETAAALAPLLSKNSVELECSAENVVIMADAELFKSLLYNIIENAVKASPKDSRIVLNEAVSEGNAVITVTDSGIGMTDEEVKKVFEPFYMADKSRSRKAGGAGLGLALCARIADLHNTTLEIDSSPGEGTTVYITIDGGEIRER
ncbi:HAMP domain-containing sensor histidine kinase [Ruminococcus sp. XPD3002]|jgi:signal transduction histidine kinase|uniref:sensor histidine kinase n=1 Tax=Ruminococcus sp. XPD3002 TaxID=1452269 RepID=UPI0009178E40|nr:Signal transduction histidine kinase [Ruminococcus flavefaciens]HRU97057.1 HAMP domain-containing sensor histidine kinase [Ruminococcus sp.]